MRVLVGTSGWQYAHWRGELYPPGLPQRLWLERYAERFETVDRLMSVASGLGPRLGPILLQLPPTLRADTGRLARCLRRFPAGVRVAVEPRHPSWWSTEVRDVLTAYGAALCWADRLGRPLTPPWRTAGWGYVRFHEGAARPWPSYGDRALRAWAARIGEAFGRDEDVHVYFNNDPGGAAVRDAARFGRFAHLAGLRVGRGPVASQSHVAFEGR